MLEGRVEIHWFCMVDSKVSQWKVPTAQGKEALHHCHPDDSLPPCKSCWRRPTELLKAPWTSIEKELSNDCCVGCSNVSQIKCISIEDWDVTVLVNWKPAMLVPKIATPMRSNRMPLAMFLFQWLYTLTRSMAKECPWQIASWGTGCKTRYMQFIANYFVNGCIHV